MGISLRPKEFTSIPDVRISYTVGCCLDVPTGRIEYGMHDEAILNGGITGMVGFSSSPNNFKTGVQDHCICTILHRYDHSDSLTCDTETTTDKARKASVAACYTGDNLDNNFVHNGRWLIEDAATKYGDEWYKVWKDYMNVKHENKKDIKVVTPFKNWVGKPVVAYHLTVGAFDSLSKMTISTIAQNNLKANLGDKSTNITAATTGLYKAMMLSQLPRLLDTGSAVFIMSAQIGNIIISNQYDQPKKKLAGMKSTEVHKGTSDEFVYNTSFIYRIESTTVIDTDKTYPLDPKRPELDDNDLVLLNMKCLRSKKGRTHSEFSLVASQGMGVPIPALSEWENIKRSDYFGVDASGNKATLRLQLYPSVSFSRTTIRQRCEEDPRFLRALNVTSELLQMRTLWGDRANLHCTMEVLRKDLTALGYDVDSLLDTRGWWCYKGSVHENTSVHLCSFDFLRMRKGLYVPHWMKKPPEAAVKLRKEMASKIEELRAKVEQGIKEYQESKVENEPNQ